MVEACLRGIDFLDREVAAIDRALAELVLASPELRRLLTLPGVNFVTACALLAAIGEIRRFPTARIWSATSASTHACVSRARSRPGTAASPSRAQARPGTCWSR